ncbi:MAG TPA: hypothetical protein VHQ41_00330 [Patescibacteria group bacterium]|jgi:hypothetical protein|nr:hypothetical protein [Patescibacteria group bacterium]
MIDPQIIASIRDEVTKNDHSHQTKILVLGFFILIIGVLSDIERDQYILTPIPILVLCMLGLINRLEVMVHRPDGFLEQYSDPYHSYRKTLRFDKIGLSIADIFVFSGVIYYEIFGMIELWLRFPAKFWIVLTLTVIGIVLWPLMPTIVQMKKKSDGE